MTPNNRKPTHPGKILKEQFMIPWRITQADLAKRIGCTKSKIKDLVSGKTRVTVNMALSLAEVFGDTPQFWLGLQSDYDLYNACHKHKTDSLNESIIITDMPTTFDWLNFLVTSTIAGSFLIGIFTIIFIFWNYVILAK